MSLAGFFVPSFLASLPFLHVREIVVEGNRKVDLNTVRSVLYERRGSLLGLREEDLLHALNERTGGRVKRVFLKRELTLKGITLRLRIEERTPVAKVRIGGTYRLIDRDGKMFPANSDELSDLPEVRTYDLKVLQRCFPRLYRSFESSGIGFRSLVVSRDKTVVYTGKLVLILPPVESIPDNLEERLKMVYNFHKGKIDLRFNRFILVRN